MAVKGVQPDPRVLTLNLSMMAAVHARGLIDKTLREAGERGFDPHGDDRPLFWPLIEAAEALTEAIGDTEEREG